VGFFGGEKNPITFSSVLQTSRLFKILTMCLYVQCSVGVFQGTAWSLRQPDSEAGFPGQMARRRRESADVFKVRAS